jgi:DNA-binding transcriptional MerR regulator
MPKKKTHLAIGELAKLTGTKVVTVRYYERIGILPTPCRTEGNYRAYESAHLNTLRFIRRCRDLGFALDHIRDLLRLSSQEDQDCRQVDRIAATHLAATEEKIADLMSLAGELRRIIRRCKHGGVISDCRVIEALSR